MVGIDEVGRGCWAGPMLVVAARNIGELPKGLTDSKLLSKKKREEILSLLSDCCDFGEGWVTAVEIDTKGLAAGLKLGVARALKVINAKTDEEIIMDGSVNYVGSGFINTKCIIDADLNIPLVSAASIYAKVTRDKFMANLSQQHPNYGFEKHVGYGTKLHKLALEELGILNGIHRTSFKPIKTLAGL
jgi:ribonuclease HII